MPYPPKIAIVGAGPGGMTLARLLQRNGIQCTIFESEPERHARDQGGSLDLHPQDGLLALEQAGLIEEFYRHARPEADVMKLVDRSGEVLWDDNPLGHWRPKEADRPEIDRTALRDLLIDSLDEGTVRWGHRVQRVEEEDESSSRGKHTVYFTNGTQESGIDLLVGAEGAFSKIRKLVTPVEPHYSGITGIELWQADTDATNPWLGKHIGAGSCFMSDQGRALLCQRQGNGSTRAYVCLRVPHDWLEECGIEWSNGDVVRQRLVEEYFADCGEDIKRTILESRDVVVPRRLYMLPVGLTWATCPGVTLLGDAAHVMTPFAGVGVNTAMADALDLANALIARKAGLSTDGPGQSSDISAAVQEYEKAMFVRAEEMTGMTWTATVDRFKTGSGQRRAEKFKRAYATVQAAEREKAVPGS